MSAKSIVDLPHPKNVSIRDYDTLSRFYKTISNKSQKVMGEIIMFILFEFWKLWLTFDGVCNFYLQRQFFFLILVIFYRS